jgi:uroporphyrinogen-III synthase
VRTHRATSLRDAGSDAVLITRPEPGASETAALVAALGLRPVVASALTIRQMSVRLPAADRVQAVLVTSGNALPALSDSYFERKLLAVGNATAARAIRLGFQQVLSADGDEHALQALTQQQAEPGAGPLLLVTGRQLGTRLAAALRRLGFRVIRRVVYASGPAAELPMLARQAMETAPPRAALFFSAETAKHFVALVRGSGLTDRLADTDAVAIGEAAGVALRGLRWRRILIATRPTQDDMLALL